VPTRRAVGTRRPGVSSPSRYWPFLYERFPDYQFVLYDDELDAILAEGQTMPRAWDGTLDGLGPGIDHTMTIAFALHESGWVAEHAARTGREDSRGGTRTSDSPPLSALANVAVISSGITRPNVRDPRRSVADHVWLA
jgi:hypothetical protein